MMRLFFASQVHGGAAPGRSGLRLLAAAALLGLAACSGGSSGGPGGSGSGGTPPGTSNPPPITPPVSTCSLRARQDWAAAQIREWYLFPGTLPQVLDPAPYASVQDYVDALTANARAQGRDRFFTYVTSIREENAFYQSGSTAAFGIRLQTDAANRRVLVADAYEGAPALAAGLDRGTEILAIGITEASLRPVSEIIAVDGVAGVSDAFGPQTVGLTRSFQVRDGGGTRILTLAKAEFDILPVSPRFGTRILNDNGTEVGYINLRTFISTADPALRHAFAGFRARGISHFVVDFRYNGGGLVSVAELMGDLLGANRFGADVFSIEAYRPEKAQFNETRRFQPQPQSVAPVRIAFIGTEATASASELVINGFTPWLREASALVGSNTFGKPVGQIARDRSACDDRLRVVAFATQNADRQGDYFDGLAGQVAASCQAADELRLPMGDPGEASTRTALDFLAGRSCTPIAAGSRAQALRTPIERRTMLLPDRPGVAQREVPGTF